MLRQANPLGSNGEIPWIFETLVRVVSLNDVHQAHAKRALADLYVEPSVDRFGILEFQAYDAIIEAGLQAGRKAIAENGLPAAATTPWSERPAVAASW